MQCIGGINIHNYLYIYILILRFAKQLQVARSNVGDRNNVQIHKGVVRHVFNLALSKYKSKFGIC